MLTLSIYKTVKPFAHFISFFSLHLVLRFRATYINSVERNIIIISFVICLSHHRYGGGFNDRTSGGGRYDRRNGPPDYRGVPGGERAGGPGDRWNETNGSMSPLDTRRGRARPENRGGGFDSPGKFAFSTKHNAIGSLTGTLYQVKTYHGVAHLY